MYVPGLLPQCFIPSPIQAVSLKAGLVLAPNSCSIRARFSPHLAEMALLNRRRDIFRKRGDDLGDKEAGERLSQGTFEALKGQGSVADDDEGVAAKDIASIDAENHSEE